MKRIAARPRRPHGELRLRQSRPRRCRRHLVPRDQRDCLRPGFREQFDRGAGLGRRAASRHVSRDLFPHRRRLVHRDGDVQDAPGHAHRGDHRVVQLHDWGLRGLRTGHRGDRQAGGRNRIALVRRKREPAVWELLGADHGQHLRGPVAIARLTRRARSGGRAGRQVHPVIVTVVTRLVLRRIQPCGSQPKSQSNRARKPACRCAFSSSLR